MTKETLDRLVAMTWKELDESAADAEKLYTAKEALPLLVFEGKTMDVLSKEGKVLYSIRCDTHYLSPFECRIGRGSRWLPYFFPKDTDLYFKITKEPVKTISGEEALKAYKAGKTITRDEQQILWNIKYSEIPASPDFTKDDWVILD